MKLPEAAGDPILRIRPPSGMHREGARSVPGTPCRCCCFTNSTRRFWARPAGVSLQTDK